MRTRNITRTIIVNNVTAYIFNKATKAMDEKKYNIVGDYEDKDIETLVKAKVKEDGFILADYEIASKESLLRSMTEEDFFNASKTITR